MLLSAAEGLIGDALSYADTAFQTGPTFTGSTHPILQAIGFRATFTATGPPPRSHPTPVNVRTPTCCPTSSFPPGPAVKSHNAVVQPSLFKHQIRFELPHIHLQHVPFGALLGNLPVRDLQEEGL